MLSVTITTWVLHIPPLSRSLEVRSQALRVSAFSSRQHLKNILRHHYNFFAIGWQQYATLKWWYVPQLAASQVHPESKAEKTTFRASYHTTVYTLVMTSILPPHMLWTLQMSLRKSLGRADVQPWDPSSPQCTNIQYFKTIFQMETHRERVQVCWPYLFCLSWGQ